MCGNTYVCLSSAFGQHRHRACEEGQLVCFGVQVFINFGLKNKLLLVNYRSVSTLTSLFGAATSTEGHFLKETQVRVFVFSAQSPHNKLQARIIKKTCPATPPSSRQYDRFPKKSLQKFLWSGHVNLRSMQLYPHAGRIPEGYRKGDMITLSDPRKLA